MNANQTTALKYQNTNLLSKLNDIAKLVGNTPIIEFSGESKGIIAKLEYANYTGSTKDRATLSILRNAIENNLLTEGSTIIESTSGNFGISLAHFSIALGLNFIPVIDPNITNINRSVLEFLCEDVIEVTERDITGGYLLSRLKTVEDFKLKHPKVFHPNQYENNYNWYGYKSMAFEIANQVNHLDYIVVAVSTGGTITGISSEIKKYFPNIRVVAVDVKGSMVFEKTPRKRTLSGLGSSRQSNFISSHENNIDEVLILEEEDIVKNCKKMARNHAIFGGASSGATFAGAQHILKRHQEKGEEVKIMMICPDKGTSYVNCFATN
ncbi:MAG: pyridoxal-phosphate dependent enzyme [Bacteroidota bacterium]